MDPNAAAIFVQLGLTKSLVGTAEPQFIDNYTGDLRKTLKTLPVIDRGTGNKEAVVAAKPDLVTGMSAFEIGGFKGNPTVSDLEQNGAKSLIACGVTRHGVTTDVDATYQYITAVANAFNVPARGRDLIQQLKSGVTAAAANTAGKHARIVALSAVPDGGAGITVRGGSSFANGILTLAGGKNVAGDRKVDFATMSAEQLTRSDPQVIVAMTGFTKLGEDQYRDAILASPLLQQTSAVKNNRVVVVPSGSMLEPGLLNVDTVEAIAVQVGKTRPALPKE